MVYDERNNPDVLLHKQLAQLRLNLQHYMVMVCQLYYSNMNHPAHSSVNRHLPLVLQVQQLQMMLASGMGPGAQFVSGLEAGGAMTEGGIEAAAHGQSSDMVCNDQAHL